MGSAANTLRLMLPFWLHTCVKPLTILLYLEKYLQNPWKRWLSLSLNQTSHQITNYRPISFLNTDIKLYAKILASRISPYIPTLIHPDQVGFVPHRQAPDGTRWFIDIIQWAEHHHTPSLLLSLDTEKAFDRVHWTYLKAVLQKFGLTGRISAAILALYSSPSARVLTSGMVSKPFYISNGTRQGCPLSPLIFALIMEPLAEAIRSHPQITGLQIGETAHKIGLYADDVIVIITNPEKSLPILHDLLLLFGQPSLYKINCTKFTMLGVGLSSSLKQSLSCSSPFPWAPAASITYLGVKLTVPSTGTLRLNLECLLQKLNNLCSDLCKLRLSWAGKITLTKMFLMPHILYLFRTLPLTFLSTQLTSIQQILNNFIWGTLEHGPPLSAQLKHRRD